jgi:hypothetical protein
MDERILEEVILEGVKITTLLSAGGILSSENTRSASQTSSATVSQTLSIKP